MNEDATSLGHLAQQRRLRRLELTITRRLDGLLHGQHLGLLPGPVDLAGAYTNDLLPE